MAFIYYFTMLCYSQLREKYQVRFAIKIIQSYQLMNDRNLNSPQGTVSEVPKV